jgi:hypothetical protein
MVNVDLVAVPPTMQEFEDSASNLKKIRTIFVVVLCVHWVTFLGEIALIWFLGKVTSEQVHLLLCVAMVSSTVSLLLSNYARKLIALAAGGAVGFALFAFIGLPFQVESQIVLAVITCGAGAFATYILYNLDAMQHEIQRMMPLDDSEYAWLCLAAQGSDFISNYLLQVKFSGRDEIYVEELLRLMPHAQQNIDETWADSIGDPKKVLWAYLDTIG